MATRLKPQLHPETERATLKLASLSNAEIMRQARARVTEERGERPAHKSVGNWTGYATVSNDVVADQFARTMRIGHDARAWDRRVNEVAGEITAKVGA